MKYEKTVFMLGCEMRRKLRDVYMSYGAAMRQVEYRLFWTILDALSDPECAEELAKEHKFKDSKWQKN